MADNTFSSVMQALFTGANSVLSTKTVVGEAKEFGETIILPWVDVSCGIGAGNGEKGAGGGMSAKMSPSAVLVIKDGHTKLVNVKNQDAVTKILDMVPDIVDKFTTKKDEEELIADEEAKEIAFPDEDWLW